MPERRLHPAFALFGALALLGAACSSDPTASPDPTAGPTGEGNDAPACAQGATLDDIEAVPVDGSEYDFDLTSFDGTVLRIHWFPVDGASADAPAPTVLMGPGWSLPGDSNPDKAAPFGPLTISSLWDRGYNVLTLDPRGFGKSEGIVTVDSPDYEGRDAQALLDFAAEQPETKLDRPGDPRAAMVGFSYGGGIQLVTAAMDCRVDAIVPGIAWHSFETSLYKSGIVKAGWANLLTRTVPNEKLDPHVVSARDSGLATGTISEEDAAWFRDRGPGDTVSQITAPTLLLGGTVDMLFTLDETLTNYELLRKAGTPVAMLWFCGGHGTCLTEPGDPDRVIDAAGDWLARYLDDNTSVEPPPALDLIDQDGTRWTADGWPVATIDPVEAEGTGTLDLAAEGGSGPIALPAQRDAMAGVVASITPARADQAVEVPIDTGEIDALALGAPTLTLTYRGTVEDGDAPTAVFAQLVDEEHGVVVGNQITPVALTLDGETHTTDVDLEVIAQRLQAGNDLTLQLVATTTAYATPRLGGEVTFDDIRISIPVAATGATGVNEG